MRQRLVVIGGDAGGMSAASQARRLRGADELEIVAFERGHFTSYSACGVPYWVGDVVDGPDALVARDPDTFRDRYAIDVRTRHEVTGIDLDHREVTVRALDAGGERTVGFDLLVHATGAVPVRPPWARTALRGVYGVQTLDDGTALRAALDRDPAPEHAVVVGAGYIGIELAEALHRRGLSVTIVDRADQPMSTLDPELAALVADAITGLGITLRTGESVKELVGTDGQVSGVRTDSDLLPADLVVLGLGVTPNTDLARSAGLPLGASGGVVTDRRMRVPGVDGVWAAGDCVQVRHLVSGADTHIPLGTHANKQGRVAGIDIGGGYATFPGVLGTAVTKLCDLEVARTGLGEAEAARAGFRTVTATIESTSRAGYFPGTDAMTVKIIAESGSGRLLGGQIVGRSDAAKRIDTLAVALWNHMTVDDMTSLDLGYAPPYAPVWDPVLVAARKAATALAPA